MLSIIHDSFDTIPITQNYILQLHKILVRLAAQNKIGSFTKQDIRELCPALSLSSVEGALRKLVESGELRREGHGKNTHYYRTE